MHIDMKIKYYQTIIEILTAKKAFHRRRSIYFAKAKAMKNEGVPSLYKRALHRADIASRAAARMQAIYENLLSNPIKFTK